MKRLQNSVGAPEISPAKVRIGPGDQGQGEEGELKQSQPQSGSTQREEDYGGLSRASKYLTSESQT